MLRRIILILQERLILFLIVRSNKFMCLYTMIFYASFGL